MAYFNLEKVLKSAKNITPFMFKTLKSKFDPLVDDLHTGLSIFAKLIENNFSKCIRGKYYYVVYYNEKNNKYVACGFYYNIDAQCLKDLYEIYHNGSSLKFYEGNNIKKMWKEVNNKILGIDHHGHMNHYIPIFSNIEKLRKEGVKLYVDSIC